jgi:hypothetical protein
MSQEEKKFAQYKWSVEPSVRKTAEGELIVQVQSRDLTA